MGKLEVFLIVVFMLLVVIGAIILVVIGADNKIERVDFCKEKGMIYQSSLTYLGECLEIDEQSRIVKSYPLRKIRGEFYLG